MNNQKGMKTVFSKSSRGVSLSILIGINVVITFLLVYGIFMKTNVMSEVWLLILLGFFTFLLSKTLLTLFKVLNMRHGTDIQNKPTLSDKVNTYNDHKHILLFSLVFFFMLACTIFQLIFTTIPNEFDIALSISFIILLFGYIVFYSKDRIPLMCINVLLTISILIYLTNLTIYFTECAASQSTTTLILYCILFSYGLSLAVSFINYIRVLLAIR